LSRLDAGQFDLHEEDVSVTELVETTVHMMAGQIAGADIRLSQKIEPGLPWLRADRRRVHQVLINLLSNAIKFTPAEGKVQVRAFRAGSEVAIAIADTGIGIAQEDIAMAFETFRQIDSRMARKYEGAGLGLPLAREMMALHGGRLVVESELQVGTIVTVYFPEERVLAPELATRRAVA
jgi:signal transduction histidine kinase